jgi:hypothetical protein
VQSPTINQSINANGGGIFNLTILRITNSTLTGNSADFAGGIFNGGISSVLSLTHATIAANSAKTATGGIQNEGAITIGNTIIANNTGGDCYNNRSITRAGVNLVKDGGCNITGALKVDPLLSPLQGIRFKYFSLLSGSPAIDVASEDICPSSDQLGTDARPKDGNGDGSAECDLGAVEADTVIFMSPTPTNPQTSTPEATVTGTVIPYETPVGTTPTPTPTGTADDPVVTPTVTPLVEGTELLQNGDFEQKDATEKPVLSPWTVKNGSGDKMKCNKPDKLIARTGQCAFQFKGNVGENVKLTQTITSDTITFVPGETLTLNLYINTKNSGVSGKVKLSVKYTDSTLAPDKVSVNLRPTSGYEVFAGQTTLKSGDVAKIKLLVSHKSASGKVYVDSISLRHTEVEYGLLPLP